MPGPPPIEARVKDLLDETRLVMLGAQLLLGIQYRAAFSPGFGTLQETARILDGLALLLILTAVGLLLGTPSFHQIAEEGHATGRILRKASRTLCWALAPLALALGIDVVIALGVGGIRPAAVLIGAGFVLIALAAWYGLPFLASGRRPEEEGMEDKQQSLETRIVQALTELRVILPGAQALFGFQFTALLTDAFGKLPAVAQAIHLISLGLVAVAVILLIAPAAYHRIAARGRAEAGVLRYTVLMMLPAEGLLMLGLVGDAYVTMRLIVGDEIPAILVAATAMVGLFSVVYGIPLLARINSPPNGLRARS